MPESSQVTDQEVLRFIYERIDSVPHLEALLLIWDSRPAIWSVDNLAKRLYVERKFAAYLLQDLTRHNLIAKSSSSADLYSYESKSAETDNVIAALQSKYRVEIVAISTLIHRKSSAALRDFADAFRFLKGRD